MTADHRAGGLQAPVSMPPWNHIQPALPTGHHPGSEPLLFSSMISKPILFCQSPYSCFPRSEDDLAKGKSEARAQDPGIKSAFLEQFLQY